MAHQSSYLLAFAGDVVAAKKPDPAIYVLALERMGVDRVFDPGRVVIGHADSYPVLDHYLSLIGRGALMVFLGIAAIGWPE